MDNFLDVLVFALPILQRILFALAINLDCRARNLAQRKMFTVLALFFPIIIAIIYAIRRKSLQKAFKVCSKCGTKADPYATNCPKCGGYMLLEYKNPKEKTLKTISIILCVLAVASLIGNQVVGVPDAIKEAKSQIGEIVGNPVADDEEEEDTEDYFVNDSGLWYDRNGIAYSDYENVKFYDKNGKEYHSSLGDEEFLVAGIVDEDGKEYEFKKSFIDEDGYFCYGDYEVDERGFAINSDGKVCTYTTEVSWDYTGQLHFINE